ncbi:MAG: hypothetical protein DMF77_06960 [Acidobacteria bacterium]|nr:MAG: hypothetical protein DMF77_06960 [Acidobacteriota bacterium]
MVFEAFTGRVPFRGATPVETLMMHVEAAPPIDDPALALPSAVLPVLRSALAKDPAARFPDAVSMAEALRAARGGAIQGAEASRTEVVHTRRLPVVERGRRPAVAIALGTVVAAVLVAALLTRRDREGALVPSTVPSATVSPSAPAVAGAKPTLPYTLAPETTVATPPARVPESAPTALRASPAAGMPSPTGATTPRPVSPPVTAAAAPSPTAAPSTPAALPSASPSPREAAVVPTAPAPPPAAPAPSIQGWLLVLPKPWAEVTVDGRALGPTPLDRIPLAPGSHAVIFTHPQYKPFTRKVEIRPGEVFRLRWDFAQDGVKRR